MTSKTTFFAVFFTLAAEAMASHYQIPESIKQKYSYLYKLPIETESDGSHTFQKGRLFIRDGVRILSLKGDRFEMAFQHGRLLQKEVKAGALPQSALIIDKTLRASLPKIPVVTDLLINRAYKMVSDEIINAGISANASGVDSLTDAYGLSEGSGIELDTVLHGAVGPESLQVALGILAKMDGLSGIISPRVASDSSSCTAFAAWGSETKDGRLLIGRNTDYPLNGYYDKFPTVLYFQPTQGQKYMGVISAGLHNAGVVGLNESGIYLGVHTVPTKDTARSGLPVFFIAQEVLRNAKNLDEAVKTFEKYRSAAGWNYLIVSTKEKRSASIEINNKNVGVRYSKGDYQVQANHYITDLMKPSYYSINLSVDDDSYARYDRVEQLLKEKKGKLDEVAAMQILGDKFDPTENAVKGFGKTVSVHTTMTSVVVSPETHRIHVATGTAPVSVNGYLELPTVEEFNADTFSQFGRHVTYASNFKEEYPVLAEAEQVFIQAKIAFEDKLEYEKSMKLLEKAVALDSENANYHFNLAIVSLKAGSPDLAKTHLEWLEKSTHSHYRFVAAYYLGRMLADQGQIDAAKEKLKELSSKAPERETRLVKAASDSYKKLEKQGKLELDEKRLSLMMQQADMLSY